MTEAQAETLSSDTEDQWAASLLFDRDPSPAPPAVSASTDQHDEGVLDELDDTDNGDAPPPTDAVDAVDDRHPEVVDLDDPPEPGPDDAQPGDEPEGPDANAGAKKTALVLGVGLVAAVVAIFAGLTMFSRHDPPARQATPRASVAAQPTAAPASSPAPPDSDQAVPFTASANCPAGSTSAQALTDTASDSAWVCVRGAPGGQVDGQVLHIDLGRSYLLTAVAITPGWVAKTPGGKDEWLAHRVVTRLQYIFNDDERTIFTQDTANTHGPVTTPLPKKVLASRVTVIILQTSRPPASPLPSTDPSAAAQPGFLDSVLGADGAPAPADATQTSQPTPMGETTSDPVDSTFAVAAMQLFGHQPN